MNISILGFQLRLPLDQITEWNTERRKTFLLREDIAKPVSVDEEIWPVLDDPKARNALFLNPELPSNGLNVHDLRPGVSARPGNGCLIAITASDADISNLRSRHRIQPGVRQDQSLDKLGLRLLGFDVADVWLYSGLSNCAFGESKSILSQRFSRSINEFGLLDSREEAEMFRHVADSRIPDHAPFIVFGLWAAVPQSFRRADSGKEPRPS